MFVVALLSPSDMGLYVVAQGVARLMNIIPSAVTPVLMPKAAENSPDDVIKLTGRAARVALISMVLFSMPLLLLASHLIEWVYGTEFVAATHVFQLLVGESVLSGVVSILAQSFLAMGRPGILTIVEACGLAATVMLLAFLVPRLGLVGAGIALLCSMLIRLTFIVASFPLVLKKSPPSLWPRWEDVLSLWIQIRR
jgi:O-antigen/teichoic acid export membrane protein